MLALMLVRTATALSDIPAHSTYNFCMASVTLRPTPRNRPLVTADGLALLSVSVNAVFLLGLKTASLGNRGWPGWFESMMPDWFPGPWTVLYMLPFWGLFACGIAILWAGKRPPAERAARAMLPKLHWATLLACGLSLALVVSLGRLRIWGHLPWVLFSLASALPLLFVLFKPCRRWRRYRAGRCGECATTLASGEDRCAHCGVAKPILHAEHFPALKPHWAWVALGPAVMGTIAIFSYHALMTASGVTPVQLFNAATRVHPESTAQRFIGPGLFFYDTLPYAGLAGLLYSAAIMAVAVRRRDGHSAMLAGIAAIASATCGLMALQTGLNIYGV